MKENYLREQCQEYFDIIEKDKTIIYYNDQRTFKNGKYIKNFWKRNSNFIYQEISLEHNKNKYPEAYNILNNLYNKGRYYLTENQRFDELMKKIEELGYMITKDTNLIFSDGYKYSSFVLRYFEDIVDYACDNKDQYPKAFSIINDYLISKDAFLVKCIEFFEMIEKEKKMISSNDHRLFKNGEKVKYFWFRNYEKVYSIICQEEYKNKYPNAYSIINDIYKLKKKNQKNNPSIRDTSIKISFDEKMDQVFSFMEENKRIINIKDKVLFGDKTRCFYFWTNHRSECIKSIKLEKNKEKYPFVYEMFSKKTIVINKKQSTFDSKLEEFVALIEQKGNMRFVYDRQNKFQDGSIIYSFWYNHCNKIYKCVCDYEKQAPRKGYSIIKHEYERKLLTFDDKIMEYIALVEQYGTILSGKKGLTFSDYRKVDRFWEWHKKDIILKFCDEQVRKQYPNACILLQRLFYRKQFVKIRFIEYLGLVEEYNSLLRAFPELQFSDKTFVRSFIQYYRDYIFNEIEKDDYKEKYPKAYYLIKNSGNKSKGKIKTR